MFITQCEHETKSEIDIRIFLRENKLKVMNMLQLLPVSLLWPRLRTEVQFLPVSPPLVCQAVAIFSPLTASHNSKSQSHC